MNGRHFADFMANRWPFEDRNLCVYNIVTGAVRVIIPHPDYGLSHICNPDEQTWYPPELTWWDRYGDML